MQVVPTTYVDSRNRTINSNQYSVTEHFKPTMDVRHAGQLPGVFIFYDLSPIKVQNFNEMKVCCCCRCRR